jgi:hypothetical protein
MYFDVFCNKFFPLDKKLELTKKEAGRGSMKIYYWISLEMEKNVYGSKMRILIRMKTFFLLASATEIDVSRDTTRIYIFERCSRIQKDSRM